MSEGNGTSDDELARLLEAEFDEGASSPPAVQSPVERNGRGPKRKREDEEVGNVCPPHPGFIHGICFRCGQIVPPQENSSVALRYIHQGLHLSTAEAERERVRGLEKVLKAKKLLLVLDLDHTLLNSTGVLEVGTQLEPRLDQIWKEQHGKDSQSLFRYHSMWTKLRPFVREFLEAAHQIAEMHVYTHGGREYAKAMTKLLDPSGKFFKDRIISQADSTKKHVKDLDVMLGAESAVIILDDTPGMWPQHKENLIQVERYIFFPADAVRLRAGSCLLERGKEESAESGQLAVALQRLQSLHTQFYSDDGPRDVRIHLREMKASVLANTVICFTSVIPQNVQFGPEESPIYQLAVQLGARVANNIEDGVTHVVAGAPGTEKAIQGRKRGLHVVSVDWLIASGFLWKRMNEKDFHQVSNELQKQPLLKSEKEDAALAAQAAGGGLAASSISQEDAPV